VPESATRITAPPRPPPPPSGPPFGTYFSRRKETAPSPPFPAINRNVSSSRNRMANQTFPTLTTQSTPRTPCFFPCIFQEKSTEFLECSECKELKKDDRLSERQSNVLSPAGFAATQLQDER